MRKCFVCHEQRQGGVTEFNQQCILCSTPLKGEQYEPTVTISTKKIGDKILISIKDNGTGIPQKIADKVFQPFFTTKSTGQGTGLGLSLAYDIVKAHGGKISVKTEEGGYTEFVVELSFK